MLSITIGTTGEKDAKLMKDNLKKALKGSDFVIEDVPGSLSHFVLRIGKSSKAGNRSYRIKASDLRKE